MFYNESWPSIVECTYLSNRQLIQGRNAVPRLPSINSDTQPFVVRIKDTTFICAIIFNNTVLALLLFLPLAPAWNVRLEIQATTTKNSQISGFSLENIKSWGPIEKANSNWKLARWLPIGSHLLGPAQPRLGLTQFDTKLGSTFPRCSCTFKNKKF